jgi:hypothetical protein
MGREVRMRLLIAVVMMCGCAGNSTQGLTAVDGGELDADRRTDGASADLLTVADLAGGDLATGQVGDMAQAVMVPPDMTACLADGVSCVSDGQCCLQPVDKTYNYSVSASCTASKCRNDWRSSFGCPGGHSKPCYNTGSGNICGSCN